MERKKLFSPLFGMHDVISFCHNFRFFIGLTKDGRVLVSVALELWPHREQCWTGSANIIEIPLHKYGQAIAIASSGMKGLFVLCKASHGEQTLLRFTFSVGSFKQRD
jgi:hypothetical protein